MSYGKYSNYSNYHRDPRWIIAKFNSICSCGKKIKRGDRIYYYPSEREAVCDICGKAGEYDLKKEISMDNFGTDCAYDY